MTHGFGEKPLTSVNHTENYRSFTSCFANLKHEAVEGIGKWAAQKTGGPSQGLPLIYTVAYWQYIYLFECQVSCQ